MFQNLARGQKAAEALGQKIRLPEEKEEALSKYKARLKAHKDGRLVMHILKKPGQKNKTFDGWISKNDKWVKMFDVPTDTKKDEVSYGEYDNLIRQLVSPSCEDAGWYLAGRRRHMAALQHREGQTPADCDGSCKTRSRIDPRQHDRKGMEVVNVPFQPSIRAIDNGTSTQPSTPIHRPIWTYDQMPCHPHWDRVLKHCGQDLDG